ncbi:PIN domain-containing protein [Patescibacteria group bacterium]|nr:PIN domain-containing protein [Patescibacteria group bacterium]MBU1673336.1 PIN domain-containing protein [Patescibacteria group bacterium]MBU1963545.1 PIN domain-containing protein [Patescibacteria group bacterium]
MKFNISNLVVVDSSVFISACVKAEKNQQISWEFFRNLEENDIYILMPINIFFEILNTLFKLGVDNRDVKKLIGKGPISGMLPLNEDFLEHIWVHYQKFGKLKTADKILAVTSYYTESQLITWDQQLLNQTRDLCDSMSPREFIKKK